MEKNTWNKTFKEDDGDGSKPWGYRKLFHGDDLYSGFSWPPRSYTCSFCKREFRSAQALGGHMNVHRRDRARLRQYSPPWEAQSTVNPNPNPNPSFSTFSPPPNRLYTFPSISSFSSPSTTYPSSTKMKMPSVGNSSVVDPVITKGEDLPKNMKTLKDFMEEDECKTKKGKMIMLDLEIGVGSNVTEDLDLELRLGYS